MAFLAPGDFLVLEKNKGTVLRVVNGTVTEKPVIPTLINLILINIRIQALTKNIVFSWVLR